MNDTFSGIVLILIGLLVAIGSALNWRIVTRSGKLLNLLFGDTIARTIYIVIGILITALGFAKIIGINLPG